MTTIGLIGCGTIGTWLARAIDRKYRGTARLVALHDCDTARARHLQHQLKHPAPICSLATLIRRSQLIIEAASVEVAARVVPAALRANRSILVMSVGGLLHDQSWRALERRRRARVHVPSGALAGLDGVRAMAVGRIRRISLITRKPPKALQDAPYVKRKRLRLLGLRRPQVIFEGTARSVVKAFPQNTNVAASLALASGGTGARVHVRVVADPTIRLNRHELRVIGDRSRLYCRIESEPSRTNPKTSEQALRSALSTLDGILGSVGR